MNYAELQVTSNYSFLRGASDPRDMVLTARTLGLVAIAITDRNTLAGVVQAHGAAKDLGLRLVVGVRLDLTDGTSMLCYPTDVPSYSRLTRLLTLGKRRAPKGECHLSRADVAAHAEGQIFIVLPPDRRSSPPSFGTGPSCARAGSSWPPIGCSAATTCAGWLRSPILPAMPTPPWWPPMTCTTTCLSAGCCRTC